MPYSFTKIEKDKTQTISLVFAFLLFFYFASFWFIAVVIKNFLAYEYHSEFHTQFRFSFLGWDTTFLILGAALIVGVSHWYLTISNLISKMLGVLGAEALNPNDKYHQRLKNVVEEVCVATGGENIQAVVVPVSALNAFAIADFSGNAYIGVTEGLLARLTRAQLEAVVGHEAAHIVSGDCLSTTVTSSLFELYGGLIYGAELALRGGGARSRSSSRDGGGAYALILLVYLLLHITRAMSGLLRMFISRQREYRADAIAVRLTRDPLSLAEALYAISYHWRGAGLAAENLDSIFIVPPEFHKLDERTGSWADLFSTHPPMEKRLTVLLGMAHADVQTLIDKFDQARTESRVKPPLAKAASVSKWMIQNQGQWQGPFDMTQIVTLGWIRPETWIQKIGCQHVQMAHEDKDINSAISHVEGKSSEMRCPRCQKHLTEVIYEGVKVHKCSFCEGTLVPVGDMMRLLIRREVGFDDRIKKIAEVAKREDDLFTGKTINRDPETLLACPKCQHKKARMNRMFYTPAYHIEIDKCLMCGMIWFDRDELEVLQYLQEETTCETA